MHGLLPLQLDTSLDGAVATDHARSAILVDAVSINVLAELRTGAHIPHLGFCEAVDRATRTLHASTRPPLGGPLRTNILRVVLLWARMLHHSRGLLEPPGVAPCWACAKLPPSAYDKYARV